MFQSHMDAFGIKWVHLGGCYEITTVLFRAKNNGSIWVDVMKSPKKPSLPPSFH